MKTFNLPANDERLLSQNENEVMEQLFLRMAYEEFREDYAKRTEAQEETTIVNSGGGKVLRDEDAKKLADTPQITGDPWFDAMERSETDASKPPLET